jgi:hypothetical protein
MAGVEEWLDSLYASRTPTADAGQAADPPCDAGIDLWPETPPSSRIPLFESKFWVAPASEDFLSSTSKGLVTLPSIPIPSTWQPQGWDLGGCQAAHHPHEVSDGEDTQGNFNAPLASSWQVSLWAGNLPHVPCRR